MPGLAALSLKNRVLIIGLAADAGQRNQGFFAKTLVKAKRILTFVNLLNKNGSNDSLAQLVEQKTLNLWVQGSIP